MEEMKCSSCKKKTENDKSGIVFMCPNCGKHKLVRCSNCRKSAVKYKCPSCEFEGPN